MKRYNIINRKFILSCVFALLAMSYSFSQNYSENEEGVNVDVKEVKEGKVTPEFFKNLGFNTAPNPKTANLRGNLISIRQVGELNDAIILTETNASEVNLLQLGDANNVNLEYKTNTAVADLIQKGNNNRIRDFVIKRNEDVSLDLIQNGDNLNFERNGVNNITKNLKFRQTEASPTIIIRSFN